MRLNYGVMTRLLNPPISNNFSSYTRFVKLKSDKFAETS